MYFSLGQFENGRKQTLMRKSLPGTFRLLMFILQFFSVAAVRFLTKDIGGKLCLDRREGLEPA